MLRARKVEIKMADLSRMDMTIEELRKEIDELEPKLNQLWDQGQELTKQLQERLEMADKAKTRLSIILAQRDEIMAKSNELFNELEKLKRLEETRP